MDDKGLMSFKNEVEIMLYLTNKLNSDLFDGDEDIDEQQTHPSIVKIFHYFEDAKSWYGFWNNQETWSIQKIFWRWIVYLDQ